MEIFGQDKTCVACSSVIPRENLATATNAMWKPQMKVSTCTYIWLQSRRMSNAQWDFWLFTFVCRGFTLKQKQSADGLEINGVSAERMGLWPKQQVFVPLESRLNRLTTFQTLPKVLLQGKNEIWYKNHFRLPPAANQLRFKSVRRQTRLAFRLFCRTSSPDPCLRRCPFGIVVP